ncbi:hypothetical protein EPN96_08115 [bacterium]|nr:MAG: hypothetical protein EPN96_08115 [bacterium]
MVKIAAIQMSATDDISRTLRKASQFLSAAASKGAKIACFPELFAYPWFPAERDVSKFELAEEIGGAVTGELAKLAAENSIAVVCPFFERAPGGCHYNSVIVFDSKGKTVGHYRKVHVPELRYWEEKYYFQPGDTGFPVFEVDGVKVGVQICWDNFFPEGFRSLGLSGAQVVFVPSAAAFASSERWLAMGVSHAIANCYYVVRVNRVGQEAGLDFYGGSFCVRPDGELISEPLGMGEGILLADCELSTVDFSRRMWPFYRDRRPGEYLKLTEELEAPPEQSDGE